jgi:hypothetical protein
MFSGKQEGEILNPKTKLFRESCHKFLSFSHEFFRFFPVMGNLSFVADETTSHSENFHGDLFLDLVFETVCPLQQLSERFQHLGIQIAC